MQHYEMSVEIFGYNKDNEQCIIEALQEHWGFDDIFTAVTNNGKPTGLTADGRDFLADDENEEEFAIAIAKIVWSFNRGYCRVEVTTTCLEELPHEFHAFDEDTFKQMTGG